MKLDSCGIFSYHQMQLCWHWCRMAPEVIACDENPDSTYDCKVSCYKVEYEHDV